MIPSGGGLCKVMLEDRLLFLNKSPGRFPEDDEAVVF